MRLLHVGCGTTPLPVWLAEKYEEVRLDINADVRPDICASMLDLGEIGPFDSVYNVHALEHLYPHEVPKALAEFWRVLKHNGVLMVIVPNLEGVLPTEDVIYESPAGPICGLDMYYGKASLVESDPHMAHHCGFVNKTLTQVIKAAGFREVRVTSGDSRNLFAVAVK